MEEGSFGSMLFLPRSRNSVASMYGYSTQQVEGAGDIIIIIITVLCKRREREKEKSNTNQNAYY